MTLQSKGSKISLKRCKHVDIGFFILPSSPCPWIWHIEYEEMSMRFALSLVSPVRLWYNFQSYMFVVMG